MNITTQLSKITFNVEHEEIRLEGKYLEKKKKLLIEKKKARFLSPS